MDPIMASSPLCILLVEDDEHDRLSFRRAFHRAKAACDITECAGAEDALKRLLVDASSFDIAVIDYQLPGMSGLDLCRRLLDEQIPLPLVIITGRGSEELAVEALQMGIEGYIAKDSDAKYLDMLPLVLRKALRRYHDRIAEKHATEALHSAYDALRELVEERTTELRRSNREVEKFASTLSRDLQEPLRAVRLYVRMLERRYEGKLDEDADACMVYALDAANKISSLVENLLNDRQAGVRQKLEAAR